MGRRKIAEGWRTAGFKVPPDVLEELAAAAQDAGISKGEMLRIWRDAWRALGQKGGHRS